MIRFVEKGSCHLVACHWNDSRRQDSATIGRRKVMEGDDEEGGERCGRKSVASSMDVGIEVGEDTVDDSSSWQQMTNGGPKA